MNEPMTFPDSPISFSTFSQKNVVLRAPVLTMSGYGVHARQIARWLIENKGINVSIHAVPWGMTPWMINPDIDESGMVEKIMPLCNNASGPFDLSVQVQLPNEWDPNLARVNVGVTAGVETDRCNPAWVDAMNRMDAVIVPSEHVKKCFDASGRVTTRVYVVPEAFPDCYLEEKSDRTNEIIDLDSEFNFLVVGQFTGRSPKSDRKRLHDTIRWLCEEFSGDPSVGIVVKANAGRGTKIDRNACMKQFTEIAQKRKGGFPKIHVVHGTLSDSEMHELYTHPKIKAYVTCTRGEGFGLPILEAAACDLPIIATNWSGHLDYLNRGRFVRLDFELQDVSDERIDQNIFIKGSRWANVLESDFRRKAAKLRKNYTIPKTWATELGAVTREHYSYASISKFYDEVLGGYLK